MTRNDLRKMVGRMITELGNRSVAYRSGGITSLGLLRVQKNIFICAYGTGVVQGGRVMSYAVLRRLMRTSVAP